MTQCKLIALTTPLPGREQEYHDWYNNVHLPELVNGLGLQGAQRYELVAKMIGADTNQYLAIYDVETDDPEGFMARMGEFAGSGGMTPSDSTSDAGYSAFFRAIGDRLEPSA
ncbi:MAG: hypothetical protein KDE32_13415 [Novosphingobium sp.]|nr:hypothetical protein [Novosphingobium sp.]